VIVGIGLELSAEVDAAALAVAGTEGKRWSVDLAFYGSPEAAVTEAGKLYQNTENCGVFLDPMPCAGILDELRAAGLWLTTFGPEDVSAAAWQFTTAVRAHQVKLGGHKALRESMRAAVPRPLTQRWAFERYKTTSDMAPLNSAAFALLGLRRNEGLSDPGVWAV
jgi:hypothetical protein